jgi:threonine synthase
MVKYRTTRGQVAGNSFEDTVMTGLGPDKGLFVPESIPQVTPAQLEKWKDLDFKGLAFEVMSMFIDRDEIPADDLKGIIAKAYTKFRDEEITPVVELDKGERFILELFHGPTFAFKDVALQFLGTLFEYILSKRKGDDARMTIVGATSGDTGSSAIHGVMGKAGIDIFIMYPNGKCSKIQEQQMITILDDNVHNIAVEGCFDDCQAIVKQLFGDEQFRTEFKLGAVNSINWARILAQIVYYFYAYFRVQEKLGKDAKVSFSVPTGNFGDILAGFYAKKMGLPIGDLIVATNDNDILHRFFSKGEYHKASRVEETISPSMDIGVSSNFERFLFHCADMNPDVLRGWMENFEKTGKLTATPELLARAQAEMKSARVDQPEVSAQIKQVFDDYNGYLLDPHSAIGVAAAAKVNAPSPVVCLACAHWAKFPDAVSRAIGTEAYAGMKYPDVLTETSKKPGRKQVLPNDLAAIRTFVRQKVGKSGGDGAGCPFPHETLTSPYFLGAVAVAAIAAVYFLRK